MAGRIRAIVRADLFFGSDIAQRDDNTIRAGTLFAVDPAQFKLGV